MDHWSRIILALAVGGGLGLFASIRWLGEPLWWAIIGAAIGLATDTSLRTISNVGAPPSSHISPRLLKPDSKILRPEKPPEPHF